MTLDEYMGNYIAVEAGVNAVLPEEALATKAQMMGWVGEGEPYMDGKYMIHQGLFNKSDPESLYTKGKFWAKQPLAVAVFEETGLNVSFKQVVAYDLQGLMWCRFDHRGNRLAQQCLMKRAELYPDYMAHIRARLAYQEKVPDRITPGGAKTMKRNYEEFVRRGVIPGG